MTPVKWYDWFTPERRQAIQVFFATLAPLLILFGFGTTGQWEQWLIIIGAALQFAASALSLVNLRGLNDIWKVLRGAIYTLAAVVSPALVLLGVYDEAINAQFLTGLSLALATLSSALAIFTSKQQELDEVWDALDEAYERTDNRFNQ